MTVGIEIYPTLIAYMTIRKLSKKLMRKGKVLKKLICSRSTPVSVKQASPDSREASCSCGLASRPGRRRQKPEIEKQDGGSQGGAVLPPAVVLGRRRTQ
jgi:hypothetical protein